MEDFGSLQELRDTVLHAGYDLYGRNNYNAFDEHQIEQYLEELGKQLLQRQQLRQSCDYLVNSGLFFRPNIVGAYGITARGIDIVELQNSNISANRTTVERNLPTVVSQDKALQDAFLRAAYDVCLSTPTRMERVDRIAENIDEQSVSLDRSTAEYAERITAAVTFLVNRGSLRYETKFERLISITDQGIREVEQGPTLAPSPGEYVTPDEFSSLSKIGEPPVEIRDSLNLFRRDHPEPTRTAFIMTQFGTTRLHEEITTAIKSTLTEHGIAGVRADDSRYHDDLFYNVLTYMHGCGLGIAVFERLEEDAFNANVSLEVGYLFAMRKPVCLLNDRTIRTLQTDLVGKLYEPFEPQDPKGTIPPKLTKWLVDKRFIDE